MPNKSETEEIGLKEIERIKLNLIWLSCKDFTLLDKAKNHILLEKVWANTKTELRQYFQSYETSLDSIMNDFKKISLTIDPKLPAAYDPEKDILIWNLWNLFFSLTQDPITQKECVISSPGWKLGGELVHEYDHYQFVRKAGMIGVSEADRKEFDKKYCNQREKRAYLKQRRFFENCKRNVSFDTPMNFIRVLRWLPNGKILNKNVCLTQHLDYKENTGRTIDHAIQQISTTVNQIRKGKDYDVFSLKDSLEKSQRVVNALSLPIKLDAKRKNYPKIKMKM